MTCIECKHCMPLEERYDQVVCINEESDDAYSNVEATHTCKFFESPEPKVIVNKSYSPFDDSIEYHGSFA